MHLQTVTPQECPVPSLAALTDGNHQQDENVKESEPTTETLPPVLSDVPSNNNTLPASTAADSEQESYQPADETGEMDEAGNDLRLHAVLQKSATANSPMTPIKRDAGDPTRETILSKPLENKMLARIPPFVDTQRFAEVC